MKRITPILITIAFFVACAYSGYLLRCKDFANGAILFCVAITMMNTTHILIKLTGTAAKMGNDKR